MTNNFTISPFDIEIKEIITKSNNKLNQITLISEKRLLIKAIDTITANLTTINKILYENKGNIEIERFLSGADLYFLNKFKVYTDTRFTLNHLQFLAIQIDEIVKLAKQKGQ